MTHGNIAVAVGDCEACGREGVGLHYGSWPVAGKTLLICVDAFACARQMGSSTDAADTTRPYAAVNDQQGETQ